MRQTEKYCIIVAGGKGTRMASKVPKQLLLLSGKPVLFWSILAFQSYDPSINIILVLPEEYISGWNKISKKYNLPGSIKIVLRGESRYHSVKNAVKKLPDNGLVAIHDGVRPLVCQKLIRRCFDLADEKGNAIPYIPIQDTMRQLVDSKNISVDRNKYVRIQTPQVMDIKILKKAFSQPWHKDFTDESRMLESIGVPIFLIEGDEKNIKITKQNDLQLARYYMAQRIEKKA
ncbi:MAG: 2-C-methyl-D-erythritol 4-phosphate cytidylyltransferase [Bacteroidota bacterium]|nr:2-C-methyl-D-erythritol 4-phosphate cytidylyltransferase [Bacteroidota bacterium]